jgi:protein gp37
MMNKSGISWCDFTWNPLTGCTRGCEYCYAAKQAKRFSGDVRLNVMHKKQIEWYPDGGGLYVLRKPFKGVNGQTIPFPAGFAPTVHGYRFGDPAKKKKPANIFVCSMADLFAPNIPVKLIAKVFDACLSAPQHNYLFLTKFPERYVELAQVALLPSGSSFWYGATATTGAELVKRLESLNGIHHAAGLSKDQFRRFVSIEPLMSEMDVAIDVRHNPDWIIIGSETGQRRGKVTPKEEWVSDIYDFATKLHIPIHIKPSKEMKAVYGDVSFSSEEFGIPPEFPDELIRRNRT